MEELRDFHKLGDEQIIAILRQFNALKDSYDDVNFTTPFLSTITARTLIVHGDRDPFFPVRIALELYEGIPRSYLWLIPTGGHIPVFGPAQQHFLDIVPEFLRDQW